MEQENGKWGRTFNILHAYVFALIRRKIPLNKPRRKKKLRIRPFRVLAVGLGAMMLVLLSRFPQKAVSLERQQAQLTAAAEAYYDAQSRNNQLTSELASINTEDFIERTARREYGYCWYGETIYEVGNLEDIQDCEIYGQE